MGARHRARRVQRGPRRALRGLGRPMRRRRDRRCCRHRRCRRRLMARLGGCCLHRRRAGSIDRVVPMGGRRVPGASKRRERDQRDHEAALAPLARRRHVLEDDPGVRHRRFARRERDGRCGWRLRHDGRRWLWLGGRRRLAMRECGRRDGPREGQALARAARGFLVGDEDELGTEWFEVLQRRLRRHRTEPNERDGEPRSAIPGARAATAVSKPLQGLTGIEPAVDSDAPVGRKSL
jgi:hypothetical protein